MRIDCQKCSREIEINPFQPDEMERQLICRFCGAVYVVRPRIGTDGFDVVLGAGNRIVRTCINCAKKFYCMPTEPIPVCPACQTQAPIKEDLPVNRYYVVKVTGKKTGPFLLEELGSMINEGLLSEGDHIETPQKEKLKAYKVPELMPYFKGYYARIKKKDTKTKKLVKLKAPRVRVPLPLILGVILTLAVVTWIYLIFKGTSKPQRTVRPTEILLHEWSKSYQRPTKSYSFYHNAGLTNLKRHTEFSCEKAKSNFIKAFIKNYGQSLELPYIALALSCLYEFQPDIKLAKLSIELGKLSREEFPDSFTAHLAIGDIFFKRGKLDDARLNLEKALQLNPQDPIVLTYIGKFHIHSGDESLGEQEIKNGLKSAHSFTYGHLVLGRSAMNNERYKDALRNLNKRLKNTLDPEALYLRASIFILLKRYEEAKRDLVKAIKACSSSDKYRVRLAQLFYKIYGRTSEAKRLIEIALRPNNKLTKSEKVDAHLLLANLNLEKGGNENAIIECDKGLALKPTDHYLQIAKIKALLSLGRKEDAAPLIQNFTIGEGSYPEDVLLHLLAIFESFKMKEEEFDILEKYALGNHKALYPFVKLALIYLNKRDAENAKKTLLLGMDKTILFLHYDFLPSLRSAKLAPHIKSLGDRLYNASQSLMNPDLALTAKALLTLQGNPNRLVPSKLKTSENQLRSIITRDPRIMHAHLGLGYVHLRRGKYREAEESLKKAQEMGIKSTSIKVALGELYVRKNRFPNARAYFKEALTAEWVKFLCTYEMGNMEWSLGNKSDALTLYREAHEIERDFYPAIKKLSERGS